MSKEKRRVPKLRFPGFTEDWEQRKLGSLASVEMNKRIFKEQTTTNGDIPFYKIGTFGSDADSFISRELFEEYKNKYPYPNIGDILISASGSIGRTVVYNGEDAYFQDSNIVWLNHNGKIDNSFLLQFYNQVKWAGLEGSTIKRLYNKNILETDIALPKIEEQRLIGKFFTLVDSTITLHQRKLEHLSLKKKALLQKLFPKNGERYPELRFPGFTDAWEQRKLGDYLSIPEKEVLEVASPDDLITVKLNLGGVELGASRDTLSLGSTVYYKRYAGQFIYGKQNFFNGSMGLIPTNLDGKGSSGDVPSFNVSNIEENYLYTYVSRESYWRSKVAAASGTGSKRIHEKTFLDFNIDVPSMDEQKLISNTFDLVDRFITLHQ